MKINEGKVLLLLTGILSGIVISSFLMGKGQTTTKIITYSEFQNSSIKVNELRQEISKLNKTYKDLQKKVDQYTSNGNTNKVITSSMLKEYNDICNFYGTENCVGAGLLITISDREKPNASNVFDLFAGITHNIDLYNLVNELKNSGAKAISINGCRIVNSTAITCEGLVIAVNNELLTPPYEIRVIGDPVVLQYSLSQSESTFQDMKSRKLFTNIKKVNNMEINGYEAQ